MKIYLIGLILSVVILSACSKKDLSLPEVSPMPIGTKPEAKPEPKNLDLNCSIQFNSKMSLEEIAVAASEMRRNCNYGRIEIINSVQNIF